MKICFFIANLGDGGAQRQCISLLNALQHDSSIDIHLMLLGAGEHEKSLDTSRLTIHRASIGNFARPQALVFAVRVLRSVQPDILISWLHPADIWSYVATRFVRGMPWILTERGSAYPDKLVYNVRKFAGRRGASLIIANSQPGRRFWELLAPRAPICVIPNMVLEAADVAIKDANRSNSRICLFVGRLEAQKNVGAMTSAFVQFVDAEPDATLQIAGQGSESDDVLRIADRGGVTDRVQLLGFRRDVPELMSRARLLLSFSLHEGMPNAVMEAVVAGLPAVVSDIPEHRALLGDGYPYYVPLTASLTEAARVIGRAWAASGSPTADPYGHARRVLAASTPENVVGAYRSAFDEVIASAGPRAAEPPRT